MEHTHCTHTHRMVEWSSGLWMSSFHVSVVFFSIFVVYLYNDDSWQLKYYEIAKEMLKVCIPTQFVGSTSQLLGQAQNRKEHRVEVEIPNHHGYLDHVLCSVWMCNIITLDLRVADCWQMWTESLSNDNRQENENKKLFYFSLSIVRGWRDQTSGAARPSHHPTYLPVLLFMKVIWQSCHVHRFQLTSTVICDNNIDQLFWVSHTHTDHTNNWIQSGSISSSIYGFASTMRQYDNVHNIPFFRFFLLSSSCSSCIPFDWHEYTFLFFSVAPLGLVGHTLQYCTPYRY